jgi:hypothetical protein
MSHLHLPTQWIIHDIRIIQTCLDIHIQHMLEQMKDRCAPDFYYMISGNQCVSIKLVLQHPEADWNWRHLSCNPNISLSDIFDHPNLPWCHRSVSMHPHLTIQDIICHPEISWNYEVIKRYSTITLDELLEHELPIQCDEDYDIPLEGDQYMYCSCYSPNLTKEIVLQNPHKTWNYSCLMLNEMFSFQDILDNRHLDWQLEHISGKKGITMQNVLHNPDIPWCDRQLSMNDSITWDDVINHPERDWCFAYQDMYNKRTRKIIELQAKLAKRKKDLWKMIFYKFEAPLWAPGKYYYLKNYEMMKQKVHDMLED